MLTLIETSSDGKKINIRQWTSVEILAAGGQEFDSYMSKHKKDFPNDVAQYKAIVRCITDDRLFFLKSDSDLTVVNKFGNTVFNY